MKKVNKAMLIFWFVVLVATTLWVIYVFATDGIKGNLDLLAIPVLAGLWFLVRRRMSKKFENLSEEE